MLALIVVSQAYTWLCSRYRLNSLNYPTPQIDSHCHMNYSFVLRGIMGLSSSPIPSCTDFLLDILCLYLFLVCYHGE